MRPNLLALCGLILAGCGSGLVPGITVAATGTGTGNAAATGTGTGTGSGAGTPTGMGTGTGTGSSSTGSGTGATGTGTGIWGTGGTGGATGTGTGTTWYSTGTGSTSWPTTGYGTGTGFGTGTGTGAGTGGCLDDGYEPNEDLVGALPVVWNDPSLVVTATSPDFWDVVVAPGDTVTLTVSFVDAIGDIDAEVFDAAGASVDSSGGVTDTEQLVFTNSTGANATFTVEVYLWSGTCNSYELTSITTGGGGGCAEDANEPNEDLAGARPAVWNVPTLTVLDTSDDWWSFPVAAGTTPIVDAFFVDAVGDIDIELVDGAGAVLDYSAGITDAETVTATNSGAATTWYLHVYLWSYTCNQYEISLTP